MPKMSVRTYRVKAQDIEIINLPENLEAEILNGLEIKLVGARDAFDSFDFTSISVKADFDRVTIEPDGSYTCKAIISFEDDSGTVYLLNEDYVVNIVKKD